MTQKSEKDAAERLLTVVRSSQVLEYVVGAGAVTIADIERALGLGRTVVYRILQTWTDLRYLAFDADRKVYRAGQKLLWMSLSIKDALANPDLERRLDRIARSFGCTANVGVLDNRQVIYIARAEYRPPNGWQIGDGLPAHSTAVGRVLLSFLPLGRQRRLYGEGQLAQELRKVRRSGYAVTLRAMSTERGSVAVPLRDQSGNVIAAMSVIGDLENLDSDAFRRRYLPALRVASQAPVVISPLLVGRFR